MNYNDTCGYLLNADGKYLNIQHGLEDFNLKPKSSVETADSRLLSGATLVPFKGKIVKM